MTNTRFAGIEDFQDIESLNAYHSAVGRGVAPAQMLASLRAASRDNARTPMQWDASEHAGFTTGTPWIPANPNHVEINAAAELADPDSVFHHYRRLIALRHTEPAVAHGDFTMLLPDDDSVYAFTRCLGEVSLLVLGNFSGATVVADVPDADIWTHSELLLTNYPVAQGAELVLRPWETRVYRNISSTGK